MKKALQIPSFLGPLSVSETAVGPGPREACASGFCDRFAKLRILHRSSPFGRRTSLLQCSFGGPFVGARRNLRGRLEERSRDELQTLRCDVAETVRDLLGLVRQLERPDRVDSVHDQRAVALEACGPRV